MSSDNTTELFGPRQKQSAFVLLLFIAGIAFMEMNKDPGDPETIVSNHIKTLVKAAEDEDMDPFKEILSESVRDHGGRDKEAILKTLFGMFFRYKNIGLTIGDLEVEQGTNADVVNASMVLLMRGDASFPDKGDFSLTFRREGNEWKLWEVNWQDATKYGM